MSVDITEQSFWTRADHEMRVRKPGIWWTSMLLLRIGILFVLFAACYITFAQLLEPARGYFFSSMERIVPPILWCLIGIAMVVVGAIIRFHALGPIIERLKRE